MFCSDIRNIIFDAQKNIHFGIFFFESSDFFVFFKDKTLKFQVLVNI